MNNYKLIADKNELRKFFNILKPLNDGEVFFISLAARKKYLTDEEKEKYNLNRAEMFNRHIIRQYDFDKFIKILSRMETNPDGFVTKAGIPYPPHCLVTYFNINPSDMYHAYNQFTNKVNGYHFEILRALQKGNNCDTYRTKICKLDVELMNCVQRCRGTKHFIDIDFDIDKEKHKDIVQGFINMFINSKVEHYIINTHSGYHIMINKNTIGKNYMLMRDMLLSANDYVGNGYEVVLNKNEMIPMPGTFQGNHIVRILNKI